MTCAEFERRLHGLMTEPTADRDRQQRVAELRDHLAACRDCAGTGDLVELLALPGDERDIAPDPGEAYWAAFDARLRRRIETTAPPRAFPARRFWVAAAAVVLLSIVVGSWLSGPGEPTRATLEPTPAASELPASLVLSVGEASPAEVELELESWEAGWGSSSGDAGALFPEVETLDAETQQRLLGWLRDQNLRSEGVKG